MIIEILSLLVLCAPLAWELYDDRNGDDHGAKNDDWILRGLLMIVASVIVMFTNPYRNFAQAFILSFAIFTALFPYLVNIVHFKRGVTTDSHWWDHLSKTAIPDKWISFLPWWIRAIMYAIILGAAIKIYIYWDTFKAWDACL